MRLCSILMIPPHWQSIFYIRPPPLPLYSVGDDWSPLRFPWKPWDSNQLREPLQSAYKPFHSCETAFVHVQNDILLAIDNHHLSCSCYFISLLHLTLLTMKYCSKDWILNSRYVALHSIPLLPYQPHASCPNQWEEVTVLWAQVWSSSRLRPWAHPLPTLHYSTCRHSTFPRHGISLLRWWHSTYTFLFLLTTI